MSAETTRVVLAGSLVDVVNGEVVNQQAIHLSEDRIATVAPISDGIPDGVPVIDLREHYVLPGMIDCHAHVIGQLESGHGYAGMVTTTAARETLAGVKNARDTIAAGFTTVRDVGTFHALSDVALRDAINGGWVLGPRMQCAGAFITVPGGGGDVSGFAINVDQGIPRELRYGVARNVDEVRDAVRRIIQGGAELIKVIATGAVLTEGTTPGACEFTEAEIRAAVDEAALYGMFVATHAHGAEGIKRAVRAGVRSIEHGSLMDDESIAMMADAGTYLVADIYNGDYINEIGTRDGWSADTMRKNRETTDAQREGFTKAIAAGVRIAYGTDSGVYPHRDAANQLPYMVRYGMTPLQGIRAATIVAAECMGWDDRVGSITDGKFADFIAVKQDPFASNLESLRSLDAVIKGGELIPRD